MQQELELGTPCQRMMGYYGWSKGKLLLLIQLQQCQSKTNPSYTYSGRLCRLAETGFRQVVVEHPAVWFEQQCLHS
jgi:hypothetical protein